MGHLGERRRQMIVKNKQGLTEELMLWMKGLKVW